jgi:hypothetical protein
MRGTSTLSRNFCRVIFLFFKNIHIVSELSTRQNKIDSVLGITAIKLSNKTPTKSIINET